MGALPTGTVTFLFTDIEGPPCPCSVSATAGARMFGLEAEVVERLGFV